MGAKSVTKHRLGNSRFTRIALALALAALILLILIPFASASDQPGVEWSQTYSTLRATSVVQTIDGGYVIAGIATSSGSATLIKTDSSGNIQWQKAVGDAVSVAQTSDLGFVVFCQNGDVIKTDTDGNTLSSFSVGVTDVFGSTSATGVVKGIVASDGTYIIIGNNVGENGEAYAWLRRFDPQGNLLWDKKYTGGPHVSTVVDTPDRGCAIAGNLKNDFWLAKLDSNGNDVWSQTYSKGAITDTHFTYSMVATRDGGFMLAGTGDWQESNATIPWLIKTDSQGHEIWSLYYPQYPSDSFSAVIQTCDEGYLVYQPTNAMLTRTDSSGSELWHIPLVAAGYTSIYHPALITTQDGGYAIAGMTSANTFFYKISTETCIPPPAIRVTSPLSKTYETSEVKLTFTVDSETSGLSYSLDGQQNVTITGNTTITGLAVGDHSVIVYARGSTGLEGESATVQFTIAARFPTETVLAGVAIAIVACISFLLYVKRKTLADYRKRGLRTLITRQKLAGTTSNRLVWTLLIVSLCFILVFVQIFFPFAYYSVKTSHTPFQVGVSYVYEQDSAGQIYNEVARIKALGFSVIRVNLVVNSAVPTNFVNTLSDVFFSAVRQLGIKVALIINNHADIADIDYYLNKYGDALSYVQILNEPDVATSWDVGALFTDDEAISNFNQVYAAVEQHNLPVLYYTNFGPAFMVRTNLPLEFSKKLDFVGLDVFMDSFLTISPPMIQLLHKITNKDIVITEFGMSTSDDQAQSDYLIRGLNLFRNMGLKGCWIVYWNSVDNSYGIRGRLAEQTVGEWIAQNS
jgi:hypothetical protein